MKALTTLTRWDRSDYLLTRAALVLVAVAVPVLSVGRLAWDWARGEAYAATVRLDTDAPLPAALLAPRRGADLDWDGTVAVHLADPATSVRVTSMLAAVALSALVVIAVVVALRALGAAQSGRPFQARVQRGLRILALLALVGAIVLPTLGGMADAEVIRAATTEQVSPSMSISFVWIAVALLLMLLAEVFRQGEAMADDVDGLV